MRKRIKASRIESAPQEGNTDREIDYSKFKFDVSEEEGPSNERPVGKLIACGLLLLIFAIGKIGDGGSKPKHNPNGGYMDLKVITDKIDRGEQLTPAEEKRLADIFNSDGDP